MTNIKKVIFFQNEILDSATFNLLDSLLDDDLLNNSAMVSNFEKYVKDKNCVEMNVHIFSNFFLFVATFRFVC